MSADSKLLGLENSLKEKNLTIVNKMSNYGFKKFAKHEYKQIIHAEVTTIMSDHNRSALQRQPRVYQTQLAESLNHF